jgi:hypothetical protein
MYSIVGSACCYVYSLLPTGFKPYDGLPFNLTHFAHTKQHRRILLTMQPFQNDHLFLCIFMMIRYFLLQPGPSLPGIFYLFSIDLFSRPVHF